MSDLDTLLTRARGFAPSFRRGLSNHLPMTLIALDRLGAGPDRLEAFYRRYHKRLEPRPAPVEPTPWPEWTDALGRVDAFARLLAHFQAVLSRDGRDRVLRETLPILMPGVAAAAFHALIRLAYGVQHDDDAEIAHALAYWAAEWLNPGPLQAPGDRTPDAILAERSAPFRAHRFEPGLIVDRIRAVSRHPDFILGRQQPDRIDWADLCSLVRRAYRASGDFTALHGLTGTQALVTLKPWLTREDTALRYFWLAFLAAFCTTGLPTPGPEPEADTDLTAEAATAWALTREDDHDIKLVHSCLVLRERADPGERTLWLAAIQRRITDQAARE